MKLPFWEIDWSDGSSTGYDTEQEAKAALKEKLGSFSLNELEGWSRTWHAVGEGQVSAVLFEIHDPDA